MATRAEPALGPLPERRPELDAIRTLVVIGLVFFHSALVFATDDNFYVKNTETTGTIMIIAGFGVVWAMPLLFLISGLGAWHSLRRRGAGGFAGERLLRLGVPLVFATLALNPLPQWLRLRSADAGYHESYLGFLPRFYDVRLELREFPFLVQGEHFETGHLWFVVLLLAFSLMLAPFHRWVPHERLSRVGDRVAEAALRRRGLVFLPALAFAAICAFARMEEDYAGWHRWSYLLFFVAGFALAADDRFRAVMRRKARAAAWLGALLFAAAGPGFALADEPFTEMTTLATVSRALFGAAGWCLVVAIPGLLDRRRPERPRTAPDPAPSTRGRLYGYLAAAVLPLYVLHQPVVVAVAYFVTGWSAPIVVEYAVLVVISLALTLGLYELLVRRTRATRFLFGMRP
ncbi:acyltransferase family protein [Streptomyces liangshanensis]|uniref:Acyltransferase family protein n=1 Tax=Streptomyces liangshanensis TaxID=2717324 RepID=A0A6G9GTD9_9ACTN|nr:acyltransferase family protein [Streptomyces liangshanensis]QIQ01533.1 acyltransferase family protein [Streptomyces liangshanensis]